MKMKDYLVDFRAKSLSILSLDVQTVVGYYFLLGQLRHYAERLSFQRVSKRILMNLRTRTEE